MEYRKYQHLERLGTDAVEGIEIGTCYLFPKIDGTNGSVWWNGAIKAGSRNRELSIDNDNHGFLNWVLSQDKFSDYFGAHPNHVLYGEWLVPHSLKTYRDDAWRNFYVFDVMVDGRYLTYDEYKPILDAFGVDYIPPQKIIRNPSQDDISYQLGLNSYLIKDGCGSGEGIVIKNYEYVNKYGRVVWAKVVTSEFKEKNLKEFGTPTVDRRIIEEDIADKYVTSALCEKVLSTMGGFQSNRTLELLNRVFHEVVNEEAWNMVCDHNCPTLNFKTLKALVFSRVKVHLWRLF